MKLRLLIGRFGEMDNARWWNTRGMLASIGERALSRGFPRTHHFARARIVFEVAGERCREIFDAPQSVTLWHLGAEWEDHFDSEWSRMVERSSDWNSYFYELESVKGDDLLGEAERLGLADASLVQEARQLRRMAENRAVQIPTEPGLGSRSVTLLGLGFFRGEAGSPAVPFMKPNG